LPEVQFWLAAVGLAVMIPGLAHVLLGYDLAPLAGLGAVLTIGSLLVFAAVMLRTMRGGRFWTE
jgi:hypothetical protein